MFTDVDAWLAIWISWTYKNRHRLKDNAGLYVFLVL